MWYNDLRDGRWTRNNFLNTAGTWTRLKMNWQNCYAFQWRPYKALNKAGEIFQPMLKDSPYSFWLWKNPKMGENPVGTSRAVPKKEKKNVLPGSTTADISAGSLVGPSVMERFREIGRARWRYAENVRSFNPSLTFSPTVSIGFSTLSRQNSFQSWALSIIPLFHSSKWPVKDASCGDIP